MCDGRRGADCIEVVHALLSNDQHSAQSLKTTRDAQPGAPTVRVAIELSQQVAKLLVTGGKRSPVRKLRELLYVVEMKQTLGKARILRL